MLRFSVLMLAFLLTAGCQSQETTPVVQTNVSFQKEGTLDFMQPDGTPIATIDIEIAETPTERATGLMNRRSMPARSGMLFLFDAPDSLSFYMRNTPMPLDIIFVDADREIVNIARNTTPFSEELILAEGLAQYVVEVRAGEADRLGLTDSTRIEWERMP